VSFAADLFFSHQSHSTVLPDRQAVPQFVEDLLQVLFPHVGGTRYTTLAELQGRLDRLAEDLQRILLPQQTNLNMPAAQVVERLWARLPRVAGTLGLDALAIHEGDPASESLDEVIAAYPGFFAIFTFRIAHELFLERVPILPRLFAEYAHVRTGIDIHPGARIGERFCIDHGTGVVVGGTCEIGSSVKLYQGVSLGALSVSKAMAGSKRHPTIEDHVVIYSNATILGGHTVIGHHSVIGGNVWLTQSVPPHSIVQHKSDIKVRSKRPEQDHALDFVI
jgi:serine O-acetyltransferase